MEFLTTAEMGAVVEGWRSYDGFWAIFASAGIQYIPFIAMFALNWSAASRSGNILNSLRPMEIDIYIGLAIYLLFILPAIPLNATVATGETIPQEHVEVPPGWYIIQSFESQLNKMVINKIEARARADWVQLGVEEMRPDPSDDSTRESGRHRNLVRAMVQLSHLGIQDETLSSEVRQFERDCYFPALRKFQDDQPAVSSDENDVNWMGSHWLLEQPGYYQACSTGSTTCYESGGPRSGVPSFDGQRPACNTWWLGVENENAGLLSRLSEEAMRNSDLDVDNFSFLASALGVAGRGQKDTLARAALESIPRHRPNFTRTGNPISGVVDTVIGTTGLVFFKNLVFDPMLKAIGYGLPYLQNIILFWIIFALIFAQMLTFYSPQFIFALIVTYSSIALWPVILEANYYFVEIFWRWVFPEGAIGAVLNTERYIVFSMVTGMSTMLSFGVFMMLMTVVGVRGSSVISQSVGELRGNTESAAKSFPRP